jgi:metal-responsive CopG/Arc/MetJ family transcriptional regulator
MKTAVSLPKDVFEEAESAAHELGMSRSRLYAEAIRAFLKTHRKENLTEKINEVYLHSVSALGPVLVRMQWASLPREKW